MLTHLHGLDGLGSAALSCISGCACEPAVMRTWEPPIPYTVFLNYPLLNVGSAAGVPWLSDKPGDICTRTSHCATCMFACLVTTQQKQSRSFALRLPLLTTRMFTDAQVTQHPRCQLRVQIVNERPQQAEHKVRQAAGHT